MITFLVSSKVKYYSIILYIVSFIGFLLMLVGMFSVFHGNALLMIVTTLYWMVATLPIVLTDLNWFHPLMFQMIFQVTYVISLASRAVGYVPVNYNWRNPISIDESIMAFIISVFITCLGLIIEYIIVCSLKIKFKKRQVDLCKKQAADYLFLFSCMCFLILMHQLGGLVHVLTHYSDRLVEFSGNTSAYLRKFTQYGIIAVFYYYLTNNKRKFFLTAIIQILIYIIMGERGGLITSIIIPFVFVYQLHKNKKINVRKIIVGGVILVFLYEFFGAIRDPGQYISEGFGTSLVGMLKSIMDTFTHILHFVISTELIDMIRKGKVAYTYGLPILNILVAPFPRRFFPWKPQYIAESFFVGSLILGNGRKVYGLPPGNFAYGYLNFGFLGVILFSVCSGFAMKWLYESLIAPYWKIKQVPNGNILLYVLLLPLMSEVFSTEVQISMIILVIGYFYIKYVTKKRKYSNA